MNKKYGLLLLYLSTTLFANNVDKTSLLNIEDDFLNSLNQVSQVATQTKLNRDRTTSLVSILQGKKLQKLGVNNVYEALKYIPGIELSKESSGAKNVIFRGSITKGEVKFMVDGVEINNAYRASYYYFLDFPIELVSRVEVLRGPATTLYGSGAISGVINVITKSSQNSSDELFISGGSYSFAKGGAMINVSKENYKLSFDTYYQEDDKEIDATDQSFNDYSFGLNFKAYDFVLDARVKNSIQGNSYGLYGIRDTDKDKYDNQNMSLFTNLKYSASISQNNKLNIALGYDEYSQKLQVQRDISGSLVDLSNDYKERSYGSKLELSNSSIEDNLLLIGLKAKQTDSLKTKLEGLTGKENIVSPDLERKIYSIYLKNNYLLTKNINIDLGIRYDDYSDFGDNTSFDSGFVYRASDEISLKLRHAHSFRAPSWTELYGLSGESTLKSEMSDNTEFGAIYKHDSKTKISLNLYHSTIEDYIKKDENNKYSQDYRLNLRGAELDFSYAPAFGVEFDFLASYTDAKNEDDNKVDAITPFLTTTSLIYTSEYGFVFGSTLRYKNAKNMDNSVIYDQSVSYSYQDLDVKLIVQNMFDSDIIYYDNTHDEADPIKDAGRIVLLKTSWTF